MAQVTTMKIFAYTVNMRAYVKASKEYYLANEAYQAECAKRMAGVKYSEEDAQAMIFESYKPHPAAIALEREVIENTISAVYFDKKFTDEECIPVNKLREKMYRAREQLRKHFEQENFE